MQIIKDYVTKVYYTNCINEAALTVTSNEEFLYKLKDSNPGTVWQSGTQPQTIIYFIFPANTPIKAIIIFYTNLIPSDEAYFETSTNNFQTVSQSIRITNLTISGGYLEVDWNNPYYRLRIEKYSDEPFYVGEIFLAGSIYSFEKNANWGLKERKINTFNETNTGFHTYRELESSHSEFCGDYTEITESQVTAFEKIAECSYICFFPYGEDSDIGLHYGNFSLSDIVRIYFDNNSTIVTMISQFKVI